MANKIRRDDEVVVLAGKDKGKTGKVVSVLNESSKLIVEGVNLVNPSLAFKEAVAVTSEAMARHRYTHVLI